MLADADEAEADETRFMIGRYGRLLQICALVLKCSRTEYMLIELCTININTRIVFGECRPTQL